MAIVALLAQLSITVVPPASASALLPSSAEAALQAGCTPRPAVRVSVTPQTTTQLRVDIVAGLGQLTQIRIDRVAGALVDIAGRTGLTGATTVPLTPAVSSLTFFVRRASPPAGATVQLSVFDGCGEWKTLVGGGTGDWMANVAAPTVTSIQPVSGLSTGGTVVTIVGTGFSTSSDGTTVTFGTLAATNVSCSSATSCTATSPGGIGPVDVTVTANGKTSAAPSPGRFNYVGTVTSVSPNTGPRTGGTAVTIAGLGFSTDSGRTLFTFGGLAASNVVCTSSTSCTGNTPAHNTDEVVDVLVYVGAAYASAPNVNARFGYGVPVTGGTVSLTTVSPSNGAEAGGTAVTLTGSGFSTGAGAVQVLFGNASATNVQCASSTTCTATSPAGAGLVDVRVAVGGLKSLPSVGGRYNYGTSGPPPVSRPDGDPIASEIMPRGGTTAGGTVVQILGNHFDTAAGGTTVRFGSTPSSNVSCSSDQLCYAVSPPGSGTAAVAVTVNGKSTAAATQLQYTYVAPSTPTISSIDVGAGSQGGGTAVTVTGSGFSTVVGVTTFTFGGVPARSSACTSSTSCTVVSPPGTGTVNLQVNGSGLGAFGFASADSSRELGTAATATFAYGAPPTIGSIDPQRSVGAGGIDVDVYGSGFSTSGGTTVWFGPKAATNVRCDTSSHCRVTNPSGTDAVDVQLAVGGLTSQVSQATRFKYPKSVTTPAAVTVTPTSGQVQQVSGGTLQASWSGLVTTGQDWIRLYKVGARDDDSIQSIPPNVDEDSGSRTFNMPSFPGLYELRLFRLSNQRVATSKTVQVTLPLTVTPSAPFTNGTATVGWRAPNGYTYQPTVRDWVGLYEVGAADGAFVSRIQLDQFSTQAQFVMPGRAATYEFRLYQNDTAGTGQQIFLGKTPSFTATTPANACGDQSKEGVYVFDNFNYTGGCALFTADSANFDGMALAPNTASAIKFVGTGWVANLFTGRSYSGTRYQVTTSSGNFSDIGLPHDDMESIQVARSNCGNETEDGVYVYGHYTYTGSCTRFTADTATFDGTALGVDTASSIKLVGTGWTATLYDLTSYGGTSSTFTANNPDFTGTAIGHDHAASIRVTRSIPSGTSGGSSSTYRVLDTFDNCGNQSQPGIYLFADVNYTGACSRFTADVLDLRETNVGGKSVKSIKFNSVPFTTATLYDDWGYAGKFSSFVGDLNSLQTTQVGNGTALSLRVTTRRQWDDPANFGDTPDKLDYGLYWFRCGACRYGLIPGQGGDPLKARPDGTKAEPGQDDAYFSNARKTIIYVHGNRPGSGRWTRESWQSIDGDLDLAEGYKRDGVPNGVWNVGAFYWNQFADDEQFSIIGVANTGCGQGLFWLFCVTDAGVGIPFNAEAKIWSTTDPLAHGMRWRKRSASGEGDAGYVFPCNGADKPCAAGEKPVPVSASMLFFNEYVGFMEKSGPLQQEVQLVGHSLGGQMVNAMTRWLGTRIYDGFQDYPLLPAWMMPSRITMVDPYFSDSTGAGGRAYLPTHTEWVSAGGTMQPINVHNGTGYQVADYVTWMKSKGVVFEYYHFTDQIAPKHSRVADQMPYIRVRDDFVMTEPYPTVDASQKDYFMRLYGWAHMEAPVWYLRSKTVSLGTDFVYQGVWPFGSFVRSTLPVPSAAMSTEDLRGVMNCAGNHPCYWWDYIGNNTYRTPADDLFERKNR